LFLGINSTYLSLHPFSTYYRREFSIMNTSTITLLSAQSLLTEKYKPFWRRFMSFMDPVLLLLVWPTVCKYINSLAFEYRLDLKSIPPVRYVTPNIFRFISKSRKQIAKSCWKKTNFEGLSIQDLHTDLDAGTSPKICCPLTGVCPEIPNDMQFFEEYVSPRKPPKFSISNGTRLSCRMKCFSQMGFPSTW
jgi:hypothetical protein